MNMVAIREWIRGHVREAMIYLVMGVLSLYILLGMSMQLYMKLIVIALLVFGTYEAIAKIRGKPSAMQGLQKGIQEAQKGMNMQMPDLSQSMEGFGPFQRPKKRGR